MTETYSPWDAADYLDTEEDMAAYLEACADEDPGDGSLIRAGLNDIARAQNMSQLARDMGVTRKGLYDALAENGNPSFTLLLKLTQALGLKLHFSPDKTAA